MSNTLAIINPNRVVSTRTYKNSETRTYGGALKFKAFCESEGLNDSNSTHAERVLKHSEHCNKVNGEAQAVITGAQSKGLVFDKISVNTGNDGVRRISLSYVKKSIPKEKVKKAVIPAGVEHLPESERATFIALWNKMQTQSKAVDIAS